MYLYDPEIVDVGLGGDPLHIVRLDVLNKDHILSVVVQPANEDKLVEYTSHRLQSCLDGLRRRRGRLRNSRGSLRNSGVADVIGSVRDPVFSFESCSIILCCPTDWSKCSRYRRTRR